MLINTAKVFFYYKKEINLLFNWVKNTNRITKKINIKEIR